jgi:hypothetical protein
MSVFIVDYASVGAKGLKEIQDTAGSDAVFFIYSAQDGRNPVDLVTEKQNKEKENPIQLSVDVLSKARAAFAAEKAEVVGAKEKPLVQKKQEKKAEEKKQDKKEEKKRVSVELSGHADLSDSVKKKIRSAVRPAGLQPVQYARIYKAFAQSPDKNEYNIALQRCFRVQKKANDIYKLTRSLFEEEKGN